MYFMELTVTYVSLFRRRSIVSSSFPSLSSDSSLSYLELWTALGNNYFPPASITIRKSTVPYYSFSFLLRGQTEGQFKRIKASCKGVVIQIYRLCLQRWVCFGKVSSCTVSNSFIIDEIVEALIRVSKTISIQKLPGRSLTWVAA